ncbi:unnamed protein product [Amoebophrya sp. A25]|nr:unnamed protein product [Amoebophrya sp. A25]|eukprot:GSA25T00019137001.1
MSDKVAKARSSSSKSSSSRNSSSSKMADSLVSDAVACIVRDDVDALRKMVATSSIEEQPKKSLGSCEKTSQAKEKNSTGNSMKKNVKEKRKTRIKRII